MKKSFLLLLVFISTSGYCFAQCEVWYSHQDQVYSNNDGWVSGHFENNEYVTYFAVSAQCWAEGYSEAGFSFWSASSSLNLYASEYYGQKVVSGSRSGQSSSGFSIDAYAVSHSSSEFAEVDFYIDWAINYCGG